jgi:hypothetical protein
MSGSLSRAKTQFSGVRSKAACHAIAGVEGIYDRHSYADEKRDALEKLAALIERILHPLPANIRSLDARRVGAQS